MSALTTSVLWNRCLAASLAVNGIAVGALGVSHLAHPEAGASQRVAKVEKKPPTRLMEIRMEKTLAKEEGSSKKGESTGGGDSSNDGDESVSATAPATKKQAGPKALKTAQRAGKARGGKGATNVDFGHVTLTPHSRTVHGPMGTIDLRNVHIKGTSSADPRLLANNQPPNRLIGKSEVKIVGTATSLAQCVGAVGGNTVYGGKATILLGKGIDIKGTKYCVPGGVPGVPGSQGGSGQNGNVSSGKFSSQAMQGTRPGEKGADSGAKAAGKSGAKGASGVNARDGGTGQGDPATPARATGPVRNITEPWVSYGYRGGGKRMGGPETDLHLPATHDDPTDRVRPASGRTPEKPVSFSRFEPAPTSVGSHSERGTIPWGPDSRKRRPQGLKGDYYLGNEFGRYLFSRVDRNVDFVWTNRIVDSRMPTRQPYSVRWTGFVKADFNETYTVYTSADDGVRLWIDGKLVIDNWSEHAPQENVAKVSFTAGKKVPIRLEYFEIDGLQIQVMKLYWESPSQPKAYIPFRSLFQPRGCYALLRSGAAWTSMRTAKASTW